MKAITDSLFCIVWTNIEIHYVLGLRPEVTLSISDQLVQSVSMKLYFKSHLVLCGGFVRDLHNNRRMLAE